MGEVTAAHTALGDKSRLLLDAQRELEEIVDREQHSPQRCERGC
jgi:hypothetical protein